MEKKEPLWKRIFKISGLPVLTVFIWEMMEELLEEAIAFGITSFITKALSTLLVIGITQAVKKALIKIFKPIIKSFTYKEGNDKMTKIKKFFSWIWSNKKSLTGIASGAVMTLSGTGVIDVNALPELAVGGFNITPVLFYGVLLILALVGVFGKGFESIKEYADRIVKEKAEKQAKADRKEAEAELKAEEKLANQTQAQQEKAQAKAQAEAQAKAEKEKAEADHKAKIDKIKAEIKLEQAKARQAELNK